MQDEGIRGRDVWNMSVEDLGEVDDLLIDGQEHTVCFLQKSLLSTIPLTRWPKFHHGAFKCGRISFSEHG